LCISTVRDTAKNAILRYLIYNTAPFRPLKISQFCFSWRESFAHFCHYLLLGADTPYVLIITESTDYFPELDQLF